METLNAYKEKLAAQLKEWEAEIELLEAKIGTLGAEMRRKSTEEIQKLRAKQHAAAASMKELGDAGGQAWQGAKRTADKVWIDVKSKVDEIRAKF